MSSGEAVRVPVERFMRVIDHVQELHAAGPPVRSDVFGHVLHLHLPAVVVTGNADQGFESTLILAKDATFGDVRRMLDAMTAEDHSALRLSERLRANDYQEMEVFINGTAHAATGVLAHFHKMNQKFNQEYVERRLPVMFFS